MKVLLLSTIVLLSFVGCSSKSPAPQPVDCVESLSPCLGDCGEGKGIQHYVVLSPAQNGGKECSHEGQAVACTASVCAVQDGQWVKIGGGFSPCAPHNSLLDKPCKVGDKVESDCAMWECK